MMLMCACLPPAALPRHFLQFTGGVRFTANNTAESLPGQPSSASLRHQLTASQQRLRDEFRQQEAKREAAVDYSRLNTAEQLIHSRHAEAVAQFHFTYDDPATGLRVMTRYRHFLRGSCCGSACRHCIYQHENVVAEALIPADSRDGPQGKVFNSAFWIDAPPPAS